MNTFSKHYNDTTLCALHDKYMAYYDAYMDTAQEQWLTRLSYNELAAHALHNSEPTLREFAAFMLIYKQNVYEIDGANEKRHEDAMLEKQLLVVIKNDCNNQLWRHNGELCIPHQLQDEMGWSDEMLNGYLLQAFGSAYIYNGDEWVLKTK